MGRDNIYTDRQYVIMDMVRDGFTNKEIAEQLGLSPQTIKWHRRRANSRLKQLIELARQSNG